MRKDIFWIIVLALMVIFPFSANADTLWSANGLNIYNTNTGSVGIGTTNPVQVLDLGNGTGGRGIGWGGTAGTTNYANIFAPYSAGGIVLGTGIKGNIVADTYLSSYGSAQRRNAIRLNVSGDNGIQFYTNPLEITAIGSTVTMNERMRINSAGRVGIGTTGPTTLLHVNGGAAGTAGWNHTALLEATYPVLMFKSDASGKYAGIGYDDTSALNVRVGMTSNDFTGSGVNAISISALTGNVNIGSNSLYVANGGNVGIGTTTPESKLDVNGNANINGNLKLTGSIISDGDICVGVCP